MMSGSRPFITVWFYRERANWKTGFPCCTFAMKLTKFKKLILPLFIKIRVICEIRVRLNICLDNQDLCDLYYYLRFLRFDYRLSQSRLGIA